MTNPFHPEDTALDAEIARVYSHLSHFAAEDDEYQQAVDQLSKLYKLKHDQEKLTLEFAIHDSKLDLERERHANEHELLSAKAEHEIAEAELERQSASRPWIQRVDPNTALTVAANIAIGLAVIKYEQTGVIATRVRDFMQKI